MAPGGVVAGPNQPDRAVPLRRPGSARRLSRMDAVWMPAPGVAADAGTALVLRCQARDVVTARNASASVAGEAELEAWVDEGHSIRRVGAGPERLDALTGRVLGAGFRQSAREVLEGRWAAPIGLLVDDLPVGALIAHYADIRRIPAPASPGTGARGAPRDVCAGWRTGGTMMAALDRGDPLPLPGVVAAPDLVPSDGAIGALGSRPVVVGSVRRERRIDVLAGRRVTVDAMFRDTYGEQGGGASVLHEYGLSVDFDGDMCVASVRATPHVLPQRDCPVAAASVTDLVGEPASTLDRRVPQLLRSVHSCTHLNDLLRSLSCVPRLVELVIAAG